MRAALPTCRVTRTSAIRGSTDTAIVVSGTELLGSFRLRTRTAIYDEYADRKQVLTGLGFYTMARTGACSTLPSVAQRHQGVCCATVYASAAPRALQQTAAGGVYHEPGHSGCPPAIRALVFTWLHYACFHSAPGHPCGNPLRA